MNVDLEKSGTYTAKRKEYYQDLGEQLDKLYHDIDGGKLGDDAKTSSFYSYTNSHTQQRSSPKE